MDLADPRKLTKNNKIIKIRSKLSNAIWQIKSQGYLIWEEIQK
jgi:predicted RNA-binding protein